MSDENKSDKRKSAVERVSELKISEMDNEMLGKLLIELDDLKTVVDLRSKDYAAAIEIVRQDFMRRLTEQKAKSFNIEGVGLITKKETDRFSTSDWATTYKWLWDEAEKVSKRKQETGEGDPAEVFSWLGKSISADLCKRLLADSGILPDGVTKSTQITLSFTRKDTK